MTLKELFQAEYTGDVKKINREYFNIQQEHFDRLLGCTMLENDRQENLRLWKTTEQTALELFQNIKKNAKLKDKIAGQIRIRLEDKVSPLTVPTISHTDIPLKKSVLIIFKDAYDLSLDGDYTAFRQAALKYRLESGLKNQEVKVILQYMREITAYIELDELNINYLWNLYQQNKATAAEELLYPALANRIIHNGILFLDEYINSVKILKKRLEEGLS